MNLSDRTKAIIEIIAFIVTAIVGFVFWLLDKTLPLVLTGVVEGIISYIIGRTFIWAKLPNTVRKVPDSIATAIDVEKRRLGIR